MPLKAIWTDSTAYSKFLLTVGVVLISAIVFTLLSTVSVSIAYGISLEKLQEVLSDSSSPQSISILKVIQTASAIGAFILPALVVAYLFDQKPMDYLKISKRISMTSALMVVVTLIVALPLINYLGELNSRMSLPSFLSGLEKWMKDSEDKAAELTQRFLEMHSIGDLLFNVFMIALLPAIGEELLFRGIIQRIFSEWSKNIHVGIWTSAILFSAMHLQFYGFIPRMLLGVMLGYMLVWSGSLWLPIIAHFVNNATAVIFMYLFKEEMMSVDPDKIGTENDYVLVICSLVLTAVFLWLIYRKEKINTFSVSDRL
jgi:membrane protease YdiL (CAAX protease family)